jgi:integrase
VAELELASDFAKASKSKATLAAYGSDFRIFESWCRGRGLTALPASSESVVAFLAAQATAGKRASTLQRRLAAIAFMHKIANVANPIGDERIRATLSGIRRSIGAAPVRKKAATSDIVLSMTGTLGAESLRQLRDRAILLIGFASAMRRSELVALNVADLEWTAEGVMIRISRSKTDQEGLGQSVAVPRGARPARLPRSRHGSRLPALSRALYSGASSTRNASASPTSACMGVALPASSRKALLGLASTYRPSVRTACDPGLLRPQ